MKVLLYNKDGELVSPDFCNEHKVAAMGLYHQLFHQFMTDDKTSVSIDIGEVKRYTGKMCKEFGYHLIEDEVAKSLQRIGVVRIVLDCTEEQEQEEKENG
ncbi:MAG: hypothetical protein WC998_00665 [Candidatus Paceibacterota bacterium]|jgi:hypothetical protein